MVNVINEFNAIFRGGLGTDGFIKHSWVIVQILSNGESQFRYVGRKTFKTLINQDWKNGIIDLEGKDKHGNLKYPYKVIEFYQGSECVRVRVYDVSLKLEPYRENLEHSSLYIQNRQKGIENIELKEINATLQQKTNSLAFGDRVKKEEEENAKHHKKVRSHYTFNDFSRGDI